jgi:hypothetical protein
LAPSTALLKSELLREHPAFISGSCALDLRKFAATSSRAVQRAALDTLVTLHKVRLMEETVEETIEEEERVPTNDEGGTSRRERRACGSASTFRVQLQQR